MRKDNKDILIGLVGTLTDQECKDIYYLITGYKDNLDIQFDLVKLSYGQYNKLVWLWGKDKTDKCIEILNDWLKKKDITNSISCYKQLITWVERKYYQLYPANDKSLRFDSKIDTAWKAKRYIQRIPSELRAYDSEVKFLVNKFGKDILS
jgi:hypothetical protein